MIERIINQGIDFDLLQKERTFKKTKEKYVGKIVRIQSDSVHIFVQINEAGWEKIFQNKVVKAKQLVPPNDATEWLKDNVCGGFTREDLDEMRNREIKKIDMLVTTGIVYHIESISEMQICCLSLFYYL